MKKINDPFTCLYPTIDVHGETKDYVKMITKEFIRDSYKLGNYIVVIIHGVGKGILRKSIHEYLKTDILVESYKLDSMNIGQTIINIKKK